MAVKSLSISDELLEKITREAKQKNISFSELVCQKISQSHVTAAAQKSDYDAEKIFAKLDSLDTSFKQTINALKKQNPQTDIELQLNRRLDIFERKNNANFSDLESSVKYQNGLLKDLYPKIRYINWYDWKDTFNHAVDHLFSLSCVHFVNIFLLILLIIFGGFFFVNKTDWDLPNRVLLLASVVIPIYYFILHRIMKHLVTKAGWHQIELQNLQKSKKK